MNKKRMQNSNRFLIDLKRAWSCYKFSFFELLAVKFKFFDKVLTKIRGPYFKNEIEVAKIKSSDKVLHIGCGICPTHSILIAKYTKAKVLGIDNSPAAVRLAKKHVKKIGLEKQIKIKLANGQNYPVGGFDAVFVAINVFPIEDVLKNLSNKLKTGTRILCKSPSNDINLIIEKEPFKNVFEIVKVIKNPETKSYLLLKK